MMQNVTWAPWTCLQNYFRPNAILVGKPLKLLQASRMYDFILSKRGKNDYKTSKYFQSERPRTQAKHLKQTLLL